jgi:hypothetical protein
MKIMVMVRLLEGGNIGRFECLYIGALAHGKWALVLMAERGLCVILINEHVFSQQHRR